MIDLIGKFRDPDSTTKYAFKDDIGTIEIIQINTKKDRDIFCVPSMYGCNLGCEFCFLTSHNIKSNNSQIDYNTLNECLSQISTNKSARQLSVMGVGDPSLNIDLIFKMSLMEERVSIATIMPKLLPDLPKNVKIHYSLHSPLDQKRQSIMPSAKVKVKSAFDYLDNHTGKTEIHYTLIKDVNDSAEEFKSLKSLLNEYKISIKFLAFRESGDLKASNKLSDWIYDLSEITEVEYYDPPGKIVHGACGQFTKGLYQEKPDPSELSQYMVDSEENQ